LDGEPVFADVAMGEGDPVCHGMAGELVSDVDENEKNRGGKGGPCFVCSDFVELVGPEMARGTDGACNRVGERARASSWRILTIKRMKGRRRRTSLDDTAARTDVEAGEDKGDVCEIEDLGTMGESEGPKLWGGAKEINKSIAGARADFRAVGTCDKVCDVVDAVLCVEDDVRVDFEGKNMGPGLCTR